MRFRRGLAGPIPRLGRVALIGQVLGALLFAGVLLNAEGVRLPFTGDGDWTVRASFADAGGIHTGERTPVLVSGVPAGEVTNVTETHGVALVTMRLDASARGVVRTDASAAIEPRSALQDMTVEITPGSSAYPPAPAGMTIAASRTVPTTTLDQVVSTLDADTRTQLAIIVDQLAAGLRGRAGALAAAVAQLHSLLDPALSVAGALAQRRVLLASLVGSLSRIGAAAQAHDVSLAQSLSSGAATLAVTARRESSISASVTALPATLVALNRALAGVSALASPLVPTLSRLRTTARALPGALRSVRAVVPSVQSLLSSAGAFARDGGRPLRDAAAVLGGLGATARALTPAIARVAPIVSAVNDRRQGIGLLGERFSGVLSTNDANGPILRGLGSFEPFNPADFGFPNASGAATAKLAAQAVQALTLTCLRGGLVSCLVRYLIPGLPGALR